MKTFFKSIKKITWEMIPVILGIWIALWVNDWKTNKNDIQFLNSVLQSVEQENELNLKEITTIIPKQEKLLENIIQNLNNDETKILEVLSLAQGFKIPSLKNTSSQSLIKSKPELVDYKIIRILADIEGEQKSFENKINYATSFLYQNLNANEKDEKTIFKVLLTDIIDSENQLKQLFEELQSTYE